MTNKLNFKKKKDHSLIFLISLFLMTRLWSITQFPVFSDEAFYLSLAEKIKNDFSSLFLPLSTGTQPLFIWLVAIHHLFIKNLILSGRIASVTAGFLNLYFLYLILKKLNLKNATNLSIIFFIFNPFVLMYNRLALLESLSLLGITLGIFGVINLCQKKTILSTFLFGFLISLGILTKATAFFVYPLTLMFLILNLKAEKTAQKKRLLIFCFLSGLLFSFLIYFLVSFISSGSFKLVSYYNFGLPSGHLAKESFFQLARIKNNFYRSFLWLKQYFTPLFFWLFIISSIFVLFKKIKAGIFFLCWFISVFIFEVFVARTFFPRYLFPLVIPFLVIPAIFLTSVFKKRKTLFIVSFLFLLQSFSFDYKIILNPEEAPLPGEDDFQFFQDWTSGKGYDDVAHFLANESKNKKILVFVETGDMSYVILKNNPVINKKDIVILEKEELRNPIIATLQRIFKKYQKEEKYIIRNCQQNLPQNWPVKLISEVPKSSLCKIKIFQVLDDKINYQ